MSSLTRWLFGPRTRTGHVLALVDLYRHTRGGHFGYWLHWFATEFSARYDEVYVVTKKPRLAQSLFRRNGCPHNVSFHRVPGRLRQNFELEALREIGRARGRKLSAFFMWGYDLVKLPPPRDGTPPIPWATFAGTSYLRRGHATQTATEEKQMQALFRSSLSCRAFLQCDQYLMDGAEKAIWIPDVENVARPERPTALAARIRTHAADRFCVGAFGQITGYRCLNELLPLAIAQPEVRFVVAGRIFEQTVAPELRPLLQEGVLPNLLVLPGFIETEEELNDAIAAADAVFIDGGSYPVQSGVVCKAIALGRCALTPRSNSWTNDFLNEWGAGFAYESRNDRLVEAWERWKADGGEARSRAASSFMRNSAAVAACFDQVTSLLTKEA